MDYIAIAKEYIGNGFNVLALQLDGTKTPVGEWGHLQHRLATEHELQEFFGNGQCGMAVVCGPISRNLHLLDFDHEAPQLFKQFWEDVQKQLPGVIDKILVVKTPRPGFHVWFRQQSAPPKSQRLALSELKPTGETDADRNPILLPQVLIETRGTGGYACAPGTHPATHPTGRPYELIHGSFEALPQLTDHEAETLLRICRSYTRYVPTHVQRQPGEKYMGEPRPGDLYNERADIRELLLAAGWKVHHKNGACEYLTRPGKELSAGYSATLGYIRDDNNKPLLMVFTTAIPPFEKDCCYDAFGCYAMIHHKGDFGAAAAQIRIEYADQLQSAQQRFHASVQERFQQQLGPEQDYKPFPMACLPEVVATYVEEHARAIDIDPAYIAVPLLSVLAGLIGPSRRIQLKKSWSEPSILWTVTVGNPSCGKSPGWEIAVAPAEAVHRSLHFAYQQEKVNYEERLAAHKLDKENCLKPEKPDPPAQLIIDDITMESLGRVHERSDRLILACEELAGWMNGQNQYRGGRGRDNQQWLRMYGGGSLNVNRVADNFSLFIPNTSVSVTGTIQPGVAAQTLFSERSRESGFAYRILAVQPPRHVMRWTDAEPCEATIWDMEELAKRLYGLEQERFGQSVRPLSLPCSDAATDVFKEFFSEIVEIAESGSDDDESRWIKLRAVAARLALIHSVTKQIWHAPEEQAMRPIDVDSMLAGITLAQWLGDEMERNWNAVSGQGEELMSHFDWICSRPQNGVAVRDFIAGRHRNGIKSADDARSTFQALVSAGLGQVAEGKFMPLSA